MHPGIQHLCDPIFQISLARLNLISDFHMRLSVSFLQHLLDLCVYSSLHTQDLPGHLFSLTVELLLVKIVVQRNFLDSIVD